MADGPPLDDEANSVFWLATRANTMYLSSCLFDQFFMATEQTMLYLPSCSLHHSIVPRLVFHVVVGAAL